MKQIKEAAEEFPEIDEDQQSTEGNRGRAAAPFAQSSLISSKAPLFVVHRVIQADDHFDSPSD